jgi:hypothetical protein
MQWVHTAYDSITEESIVNTFRHIGYRCTANDDPSEAEEVEESSEQSEEAEEVEEEEGTMDIEEDSAGTDNVSTMEVELEYDLDNMEINFDLGQFNIDTDDVRLPGIEEIIQDAAVAALRNQHLLETDESEFY